MKELNSQTFACVIQDEVIGKLNALLSAAGQYGLIDTEKYDELYSKVKSLIIWLEDEGPLS